MNVIFQSTFPLQGTTGNVMGTADYVRNFNPRSHCRERLRGKRMVQQSGNISIHVPIAGNDDTGKPFDVLIHFISIHVPIAGNDKFSEWLEECNEEFQSTFPLQGTTDYVLYLLERCVISIHVPIAGNDRIF